MEKPIILVLDEWLPQDIFEPLQEKLLGEGFPWYFQHTVDSDGDLNDFSKYQFVMQPVRSGRIVEDWGINELLTVISPLGSDTEVLRAKFNLQPWSPSVSANSFHVDLFEKDMTPGTYTGVYYFNTCNGYTEFENGLKVESVANRLLLFSPNLRHRGTTSSNCQSRVVLNINVKNFDLPANALSISN